jgi:hypothetical protein
MKFSCDVRVDAVRGEDFGATATLVYQQDGGIDIDPGTFQIHITEDAAQLVKPGAVLTLSLESK